jgi:hypothetical protein
VAMKPPIPPIPIVPMPGWEEVKDLQEWVE